MSLALYRRYRPETFAEVIGQEHVTGPLQQALRNNRVNHAYLFSGPRGCGKTSSARILARALNCELGPTPEPCGKCDSCLGLGRGGGGSIDVIEIDAASHGGVDDARDLRDRAFFSPAGSRYKIYIIDEAHMVTAAGFNALLKVVEEPPEHLKFIFATTEPEKVIGTIRSRTHHYPFRLVPPKVLQDYLEWMCREEGVEVAKGVLPLVVRAGQGSVRDALSVLDQLVGGAGEAGVTYAYAASLLGFTDAVLLDSVVDAFAAGDGAAVFEVVDRVVESGIDPRRFAADLLERLRDLVILQAIPDAATKGLLQLPEDQLAALQAQAGRFGSADLSRIADVVNDGLAQMRGATAPRLQLELICARAILPGADAEGARGIRARVDRLERRWSIEGGPAAGSTPVAPAAPAEVPAEVKAEAEAVAPPAQQQSPPKAPKPEVTVEVPARQDPVELGGADAGSADAGSGLDLHGVRMSWPDVLERVKTTRRVTWIMLFDKVQVLSLDGGVLTLGFPDAGAVKGFASGSHDEVLRQSLIDVLGVDWRIDAVHAPGSVAAAPAAPVGPATPAAAASAATSGGSAAGARVATEAMTEATTEAMKEDVPSADDADVEDSGLAGAELVAKELGGRVIDEFGGS